MTTYILLNTGLFLLQSGVLLILGLLLGRLIGHNHAARRQLVYRCTLLGVLACPFVSLAFPMLGAEGIAVCLPESLTRTITGDEVSGQKPSEITTPITAVNERSRIPMNTFETKTPAMEAYGPRSRDAAFPARNSAVFPPSAQATTSNLPPAVAAKHEPPRLEASDVEPVVTPSAEAGFSFEDFSFGMLLAWGIITSIFFLRMLHSHRKGKAMLRYAIGVSAPLEARLKRLSAGLGIKKHIGIMQSPFISSPCLLGTKRPVILLPESLPESERELDAILIHELAHFKRSDVLWRHITAISVAIFFFQPLLWAIRRRMQASSEEICDDEVLHFGIDSSAYAEQLIAVASLYSPGNAVPDCVLAMAVRKSRLRERIERILDSNRIISVSTNRRALLLIAAMAAAMTCMVGGVSLTLEGDSRSQLLANVGNDDEIETESNRNDKDGNPIKPPKEIEFRLGENRKVTTEGRVLLPDGSPAGKTWLLARHVSGWQNLSERLASDENGKFTAKSHVGGYFMVIVDSPQKGNDKITGLASSIVAQMVSDPPTPGQYDIRMIEGTKLYGKLTYKDGTPAKAKKVFATIFGFDRENITTFRKGGAETGASTSITFSAETDDNGEYSIRLAPGEYDIIADDGIGDDRKVETTIIEGDKELKIDFTIPNPTPGKVVFPDGSPAAGLKIKYVSFPSPNSTGLGSMTTDAEGDFSITLSPFGNLIYVSSKDGKFGIARTLYGDDITKPLRLELQPACSGKMRLISKETGKPISGHPVQASLGLTNRSGGSGFNVAPTNAISDENGDIEIKPLYVGGTYSFGLTPPKKLTENSAGTYSYPHLDAKFEPTEPGESVDLGEKEIEGDFSEFEPKAADTESKKEAKKPRSFSQGDSITVKVKTTVYSRIGDKKQPVDTIEFTMVCKVVSAQKDGMLAIRGEKLLNSGTTRGNAELSGTVRSEDIGSDDTISSDHVANMTLKVDKPEKVEFQIENGIPQEALLNPENPDANWDAAASIVAVDTEKNTRKLIRLPVGSTVLRDTCRSSDGKYVFVTHQIARFQMPCTQIERGWRQCNALSIIDAEKQEYYNTVLLDDVDRGAANPWGLGVSEDGKSLYIALAGTHELMVVDLPGMMEKLKPLRRFTKDEMKRRGDKSDPWEPAANDVMDDLAFLHGLKKRIPLDGFGPRELTVTGKEVRVRMHFSDSENIVDFSGEEPKITTTDFLNFRADTPEWRGELYFNDATLCFQNWLSCASCHPEGRIDGLNWDMINNGIGNPSNTKSLLGVGDRALFFANGTHDSLEKAVNFEIEAQLNNGKMPETDEKFRDIIAYMKSIKPLKNPVPADREKWGRGQELFASLKCAECHSGDWGTDSLLHDVGTKGTYDRKSEFVTPPLTEVCFTAPYLHDGRYADIAELFTKGNHGIEDDLKAEELSGLVEYLRHFGENPPDATPVSEVEISAVTIFLDGVAKKRFDDAVSVLTEPLRAEWSGEKLQTLFERCERDDAIIPGIDRREQTISGVGPLKGYDLPQTKTYPGGTLSEAVIRFENASMLARMALNDGGRISAFEFCPIPDSPAPDYCGWCGNAPEIGKRLGFDHVLNLECFDAEGKKLDLLKYCSNNGVFSIVTILRKTDEEKSESDWTNPEDASRWEQISNRSKYGEPDWKENVFHFRTLPAGTYRILLSGYSSNTEDKGSGNVLSEQFVLDTTSKERTISLRLKPSGSLRLVMIDETTEKPVENALTRDITSPSLPSKIGYGWYIAHNARQKHVNLPPGKYSFSVWCSDRNPDDPVYEPVDKIYEATIEAGKETEVVVRKKSRPHTLEELNGNWPFIVTGTVRDPSGNPLDGVTVTVRRSDVFVSGFWPETSSVSGKDGRFSLRFNPRSLETVRILDPRDPPTPEKPDCMEIRIETRKMGYTWKGVLDSQGTVHGENMDAEGNFTPYSMHFCCDPAPADSSNVEYGYDKDKRKLDPAEIVSPLKPYDLNIVMEPAVELIATVLFEGDGPESGENGLYSPHSPYVSLEPEVSEGTQISWTRCISGKTIDEKGRFSIDAPPVVQGKKYRFVIPAPAAWTDGVKIDNKTGYFEIPAAGKHLVIIRWKTSEIDGVKIRKPEIESVGENSR